MHENFPSPDNEPGYTPDHDKSDVFEINGREILISRHSAIVAMYNEPRSRRYNHVILNPQSENPIRQFTTEHAEIHECLSIIPPIVSFRPEDSVREAYWEFMSRQDVELDEEDLAERERVAQRAADRIVGESVDAGEMFAELLGSS